ncbi:M18 family aminopeptidase [Arenicella xantha]|uniref:M18 family aminopeptidase n=1 Tax=Arenicella xantha TaxID=644221 RepID=A0A395JL61_9GAMM|nr:M18 family aminopeptidase [Arenicella xantha]RBP49708.1 aspartyl aminopeptidase [Arenicella xantha]
MSNPIAQSLCDFIAESPTPFHATQNLLKLFTDAGFEVLHEGQDWSIEPHSSYAVTRNDSSIIAFRTGADLTSGIQMIGAHTDSPCLKIKPNPEIRTHGYLQLGVEVYGGALLHPWLDRDLSIAGRVSGLNDNGEIVSELIDFKRPIAIIPNLAIHLDREANSSRVINPQNNLPLILTQQEDTSFEQLLLQQCRHGVVKILEYELSCYDTQVPQLTGLHDEFVSAARLDNLLSSYIGARALVDTESDQAALYISTDHEEVGSSSAYGANGPFLKSVLERITNNPTELTQTLSRSLLLSCDNAHGIHPNYSDKHDKNHGPILNAGPVIKINSNQRYASTSVSSAKFQARCAEAGVPLQKFVTRSDMACGSTIGPITSSQIGIETLDVGAPQWGMHSIRETAGTQDCEYLYKAACAFLR